MNARSCRRLSAALFVALALASCGRAPQGPSPAAAPPAAKPAAGHGARGKEAAAAPARPAPGYVARLDSLPSPAERAALHSRRIVLDPGHGGYFRGSMGVNGLAEADVNLGVALRLRDLLVADGAIVLMTRDRDRDFLTRADSTLKFDLAERARIANAFAPDLFVSVHHNADAGGRHDVNETQTYYKLGDEGPSYDLGTDVHRAMVRNLGIETHKLLPGNFSVVRNSDAPALLTEASYLTNPDVEARLATPEAQQLEAEAIYLGVARWFARPRPVVDSLSVSGIVPGEPLVVRTGLPEFVGHISGACDAVDARVDGQFSDVVLAEGRLSVRPREPLVNGMHELVLNARLAAGGAARTAKLTVTVAKPLVTLEPELVGGGTWNGAEPRALRVRLRDADGLPVGAVQPVYLRVEAAHGVAPVDTMVFAAGGEAWFHLRATRALRRDVLKAFVRTMGETREITALARIALEPGAPAHVRAGIALAMPAAEPLRDEQRIAWLSRTGFATVPADSGRPLLPQLPGWRLWGESGAWPPRFVPLAGGALRGRRIALDPEGGGEDAAGMGRSGTRAATLNLEVARSLAAMLRAAGAAVVLTRQSDAAVSELERVQVAERFRADRFLRIGHAAAPPLAGYYFSSGGGRRWAQALALACAELGIADSLASGESAKYALSQVSAVALYASLRRVDDPASEERLLAPGALRAEAYALFLALAREYAAPVTPAWPTDRITLRRADGSPAAGALVTLGGALLLQAGADGVVRFARTEPGPLEVRSADSGADLRGLLLDSDRDRTLTGAR